MSISIRIETAEIVTLNVTAGDDANALTQDVRVDIAKLGPEALAYLFDRGIDHQRDVYAGVKKGSKKPDGTVVNTVRDILDERVRLLTARFENLAKGQVPKAGARGPSVGIPNWDTFRDVVLGVFKKRGVTLDLKALIVALREATDEKAKGAVLRERVFTPLAVAKAGRAAKPADIDAMAKAIGSVVADRVKRAVDDLAAL